MWESKLPSAIYELDTSWLQRHCSSASLWTLYRFSYSENGDE